MKHIITFESYQLSSRELMVDTPQSKSLTEEIYEFTNELYKEGVILQAFVKERSGKLIIILGLIRVDNDKPGEGTRAMDKLIEFADRKGLPISLLVSSNYGSDADRLEKFYNRFNFKTTGIDTFTKGKEMWREPQ